MTLVIDRLHIVILLPPEIYAYRYLVQSYKIKPYFLQNPLSRNQPQKCVVEVVGINEEYWPCTSVVYLFVWLSDDERQVDLRHILHLVVNNQKVKVQLVFSGDILNLSNTNKKYVPLRNTKFLGVIMTHMCNNTEIATL